MTVLLSEMTVGVVRETAVLHREPSETEQRDDEEDEQPEAAGCDQHPRREPPPRLHPGVVDLV